MVLPSSETWQNRILKHFLEMGRVGMRRKLQTGPCFRNSRLQPGYDRRTGQKRTTGACFVRYVMPPIPCCSSPPYMKLGSQVAICGKSIRRKIRTKSPMRKAIDAPEYSMERDIRGYPLDYEHIDTYRRGNNPHLGDEDDYHPEPDGIKPNVLTMGKR